MPNSRLEAALNLTEEQIELLGGWTTNGNNLLGGGGDKLGSNDNFGFFFITNDIRRGGFFNTGEFFLSENGQNSNHRFVNKPFRRQTVNAADFSVFSFAIPENTTYRFGAKVQFRNFLGDGWGMIERVFCVNKENGNITFTDETMPITEREGVSVANVNVRWEVIGNNVELIVNGIAATQVNWSGLIQYQGVENS